MKLEVISGISKGKGKPSCEDAKRADSRRAIFIVADGISKKPAGSKASNIAVSSMYLDLVSLRRELNHDDILNSEDILSYMKGSVEISDRFLYEGSLNSKFLSGMGTTLDAAFIHGGVFYYAHAGDGRIYLFRSGSLYQLTEDHVVLPECLEDHEKEAYSIDAKLENHIGSGNVKVDVSSFKLQNDDIIWMQTDGVSKIISNQGLENSLHSFMKMPMVLKYNRQDAYDMALRYCRHFGKMDMLHEVRRKLGNDDMAYIGIKVLKI